MEELDDIFAALDALPVESEIADRVEERVEAQIADTSKIASMDDIEAIANEVFGEERVYMNRRSSTRFELTIYFPRFTISNSYGQKHVIRGLYVKFDVTLAPPNYSVTMYGVRMILTPEEYYSGYGHSHLHIGMVKGTWDTFCQGSSSFKAITLNLATNPSADQWYLVLMSLPGFVEWESVEGVPYIRMEKIGSGSRGRSVDFHHLLLDLCNRKKGEFPAEAFDFEGSHLLLNPEHGSLREFWEASPIRTIGRAGSPSSALEDWRANHRNTIPFKGRTIEMQFVSAQDTDEGDTLSPDIIRGLRNELNNELSKFNNQFQYAYYEHKFESGLGKVPSFEQADIDHYKKLAKANRVSTQRGRRTRVVGRVDHKRKGEDNRP